MFEHLKGSIEVLPVGINSYLIKRPAYTPEPVNTEKYQRLAAKLFKEGDKKGAEDIILSLALEGSITVARFSSLVEQMK